MTSVDKFRARRLSRLHREFLVAAEQYPLLGHVACTSETERLWTAMQPAWDVASEQKKRFCWFWGAATIYGDYGAFSYYVGTPQRLYFRSRLWVGRYAYSEERDEQFDSGYGDAAVDEFLKLSQEAMHHLSDPGCPPVHVDEDREFPCVANPWLNEMYRLFDPTPEKQRGPDFVPLRLEDGESFEVVGLPCNVFLASARAIEILMDKNTTSREIPTPERTADSKTDKQRKRVTFVPKNLDVAKLAQKINRELPKGGTMVDIARDFTNGDEKKAQSLLRQLRGKRFRNLLN